MVGVGVGGDCEREEWRAMRMEKKQKKTVWNTGSVKAQYMMVHTYT